eukprot:12023602-Ditylum_brightwellii.AAC.1
MKQNDKKDKTKNNKVCTIQSGAVVKGVPSCLIKNITLSSALSAIHNAFRCLSLKLILKDLVQSQDSVTKCSLPEQEKEDTEDCTCGSSPTVLLRQSQNTSFRRKVSRSLSIRARIILMDGNDIDYELPDTATPIAATKTFLFERLAVGVVTNHEESLLSF